MTRAPRLWLASWALPLAQAATVVASQHLSYETYLERLRQLPVADLLVAEEAGGYPRTLAAVVQLSLDAVRVIDETGASVAVMDLLAVLSPFDVRRSLLHAAGRAGFPGRDGPLPALAPEAVDRALARLTVCLIRQVSRRQSPGPPYDRAYGELMGWAVFT
jgi:hypothetical protein